MTERVSFSVDADDRARARAFDQLLEDFAAHHPDQPLSDAERAWARNALGAFSEPSAKAKPIEI